MRPVRRNLVPIALAALAISLRRLSVAVFLACLAGVGTSAADARMSPADTKPASTIVGRFDVGGHKLYLRCEGTGSPTVVYIHGASDDGRGGARNAADLPRIVRAKHRICVYDRANLGDSDKVPGPIGGRQLVSDLHALLHVAGVAPPYVLLGASFGGLVASAYASTYPKQVKGMVLLDAAFPTELGIDHFWPADERFKHDDWKQGAEKIDQLDVYEYANRTASHQPAIPVTYLLATPETWTTGPVAYRAAVLPAMARYVHSFSPGVIKPVKSPHWMENAVPDRIAAEIDLVVRKISGPSGGH
jgi:pimeloyl-ACP methyl ester carboxylesterase